ncbi:MAG: HAD-IIA family hydrolase [Paenibacillaceae bacterium]
MSMHPIQGLIIDLDGTVFRGDELIDGTREAINDAVDMGKQVVFLSNRGNISREAARSRLSEVGIDVTLAQIILSSSVAAAFLRDHYPSCQAWVLGEEGLIDELKLASVTLAQESRDADWLVISLHEQVDYEDLNHAFVAIRHGARILATNADRTFPRHDGDAIDVAGMIGAITNSTGKHVDLVVGKPSWLMAEAAMKQLQLPPEQCLMIGDSLETDMAFGRMFGMKTMLVLTGSTNQAAADSCLRKPDYIVDSLANLHQVLKN